MKVRSSFFVLEAVVDECWIRRSRSLLPPSENTLSGSEVPFSLPCRLSSKCGSQSPVRSSFLAPSHRPSRFFFGFPLPASRFVSLTFPCLSFPLSPSPHDDDDDDNRVRRVWTEYRTPQMFLIDLVTNISFPKFTNSVLFSVFTVKIWLGLSLCKAAIFLSASLCVLWHFDCWSCGLFSQFSTNLFNSTTNWTWAAMR